MGDMGARNDWEDMIWVATEVGTLLEEGPHVSPGSLDIVSALGKFIEKAWVPTVSGIARRASVPASCVRAWSNGWGKPSLKHALGVCSSHEVGLTQFLKGELGASDLPFPGSLNRVPRKIVRLPVSRALLERTLGNAAEGSIQPPPPLPKLARQLGKSERALWYDFPEQCRKIVDNREAYLREGKTRRKKEKAALVRETVRKLHIAGKDISLESVGRAMGRAGLRRDRVARAAWESAVNVARGNQLLF